MSRRLSLSFHRLQEKFSLPVLADLAFAVGQFLFFVSFFNIATI